MKCLITGGAGFIGFHLAKHLLQQGYQVDIVDNFYRSIMDDDLKELLTNPNIQLHNENLLESAFIHQLPTDYDLIFHFAAIIGVANVLSKPFEVLRDNNFMLINMLELAKKQTNLTRFVFTSTSEVYAGTLQNFSLPIPTPESTPLALTNPEHPRTSYMLSKIYGEALCLHSTIPVTIVRPHNIYGPRMGMSHVIPELMQRAFRLKEGDLLDVFSTDHKRTFCYVQDAVIMLELAAKNIECEGKVMNIGAQQPEISIGDLAQLIIEQVGKKLLIKSKPDQVGSPNRRCPDMTLTKSLTGYEPQISLGQGLELTYQWYYANVFTGKGESAK